MKPSSTSVVQQALALLARTPPISYTEMDCQQFVKTCVRGASGTMQFAGSNDMFRNACEWIGTIVEAKAQGRLVPGVLLFILEPTGGEPDKYKPDGLGDASHVGLYLGEPAAEVAHSSASRGQVAASTLKNGWTHVGLAKAIDYGTEAVGETPSEEDAAVQYATVDVPQDESLRMRNAPSPSGEYMLRIPRGTLLCLSAHQNGFAQTAYGGHEGWVDERYLRYVAPEGVADEMVQVPRETLYRLFAELASLLGVRL